MNYCVYNAIRTPDGTILHCENRHDYQQHFDKVVHETYMNDGGGYYVRRSVNIVPFEDLSVWSSDTHEKIRNVFSWGTRGVNGDEPLRQVLLKDMSDDHIKAILRTQRHIDGTPVQLIFHNELEWRSKDD